MTKYIFFSGKGGVGKTTMAAATAVHYALSGKKTLIVTTDPASNLSDVFEQKIGHRITPVKIAGSDDESHMLHAMEIDPDEATREYKEGIIGPFREMMPEDVIASLEENLSGPCTTEMASFDRFIDFMETNEYDVIVFDTAPTGHTIRLLELPVDWSRHIEESSKGSGQTCLGPVQSIQESKDKYDRATALLKDRDRTTFIFVMRPEGLSLYETMRAAKELENIGIRSAEIIINGVFPEEACEIDFFRIKFEAQKKVIIDAEKAFSVTKHFMLLRDLEISGIDSLTDVAAELFGTNRSNRVKEVKGGTLQNEFSGHSDLDIERPDLDSILFSGTGTRAIFFTGKGGVGKTTISCLAALHAAGKGHKTLIVTTDPAAHIGEVFGVNIGSEEMEITENLSAVMIDQEEAFIQYREKMLDEASGKYSDDMMTAMEEELNSPCIKEMAAFDSFIQFIESSRYDIIIFDTAPTGHTLRLLDLPFDYAKQVEMMISSSGSADVKEASQSRFSNIINMLRDKSRTVFCLVLYPESTPILESHRAMLDLKEAGIETQLIISNMVLPAEVCTNDFFRKRREMQAAHLKDIRKLFDLPVLTFPLMEKEITGMENLKKAGLVFDLSGSSKSV